MMTRKILESIQKSIVPTKRLMEGSEPIKLRSELCLHINCYAYSLGIMYAPQLGEYFYYRPGFTVNCSIDWEKDLRNAIETDLNNLEVTYRVIPLHGSISLKLDEYLVKVFLRDNPYSPDFHFVRYDPSKDIWFHKEGYYSEPWIVPIDPYNAMFSPYGREPKNYGNGTYKPCGYLAIKEPQEQ